MPSSGDLPNSGIEPVSPAAPALADSFFTTGMTWEATVRSDSAVVNEIVLFLEFGFLS